MRAKFFIGVLILFLQSCTIFIDDNGTTVELTPLSTRYVGISSRTIAIKSTSQYPEQHAVLTVTSHAERNERSSWSVDTTSLPTWITSLTPTHRSGLAEGTKTELEIVTSSSELEMGEYETTLEITGKPFTIGDDPTTVSVRVILTVQ